MPSEPVTVLVTCLGGALSVEVVQALAGQRALPIRVIGTDRDERTAAAQFVDACHRVPDGADPDYIASLLEICAAERVQVVIARADEEVEAIAASRGAFERAGIRCAVPEAQTVRLLRHKTKLLKFLEQSGIRVAGFKEAATAQELTDAAAALGYPARPVVVKPCTARGGRGALLVDAATDPLREWFTERAPWRTTLETLASAWGVRPDRPALLVMEYLPGDAYDIDVLSQQGTVICSGIRKRYNPRGIPFTGCMTETDDAIQGKVEAAIAALKLDFGSDVDLAIAEDGEPQILEINPRFSGSIAGSLRAGGNFPLELVRMALGLPVVPQQCAPGVETTPYLLTTGRALGSARHSFAGADGAGSVAGRKVTHGR